MISNAIHRVSEDLFLVDLDLPGSGLTCFISSWIMKQGERAIIIDPGPSSTINILLNSLNETGIRRVDYILLTHIHLDHAGACGDLAKKYPDSLIVCHPSAVAHLINPARLWKGSLNVLGDLAVAYGMPSSVIQEKICGEKNILWENYTIQSLETPGHAAHHMCYFLDKLVFAGEVAGVHIPINGKHYIRPATPPPFRPEIALKSISLVAERNPDIICYGHYGMYNDAVSLLNEAKKQIKLWLRIIEDKKRKTLSPDEMEIFEEILARDRYVRPFHLFDSNIKKRETYFIINGIKGMLDITP